MTTFVVPQDASITTNTSNARVESTFAAGAYTAEPDSIDEVALLALAGAGLAEVDENAKRPKKATGAVAFVFTDEPFVDTPIADPADPTETPEV
jgi:hypothetical protein